MIKVKYNSSVFSFEPFSRYTKKHEMQKMWVQNKARFFMKRGISILHELQ